MNYTGFSGMALQGSSSGAKPRHKSQQNSSKYDGGNSCTSALTSYTGTSQIANILSKSESVVSQCLGSHAYFDSIIQDEQTGSVAVHIDYEHPSEIGIRDNSSSIFVDSPRPFQNPNSPICDCFSQAEGLNSPAVNEKTALDLADITVDQSFGSDLAAIDDILTDSFIAGLQNVGTPSHDHHYSSAKLSNPTPTFWSNGDNLTAEAGGVLDKSISPFENEIFGEILEQEVSKEHTNLNDRKNIYDYSKMPSHQIRHPLARQPP